MFVCKLFIFKTITLKFKHLLLQCIQHNLLNVYKHFNLFYTQWNGFIAFNGFAEPKCKIRKILKITFNIQQRCYRRNEDLPKVYWPSPVISIRFKWMLCHLTWHLSCITRFLIKLQHYGIDQLYLHKVPWYLIDWRFLDYI